MRILFPPLVRRGVLAALALIMAVFLFTGCSHGGGDPASEDKADTAAAPVAVELATAETRPMSTTILAQGTLSPGQGAVAHVAAVTAGRLVSVLVREGDRVRQGQVVALIDSRPQQAQAQSAAAAYTAAESQAREAALAAQAAATDQTNGVRLARLALEAAQRDRDSAVAAARLDLETALTDLHKTQAGARPQEIAQADQTVAQDEATYRRAQTELARVQYLYDKGIDAKRQLDDAQAALAVAESTLQSAQAQDSLVKAGARPEDLRAAQLRVDQARQALAAAKTGGDTKVQQAQAALRQARQAALQVAVKQQDARAMQDTAAQKRADLTAAQAAAGYAALHAPLNGVVTHRALNPGDMADPTTPVLEITDTRALNLLANLPAEDGMNVRIGMPVIVSTADAPGHTFTGRVLSVGEVDPQTNLMTARIAVANPEGLLKVGSFATADIVLRTDPQAVVIPKQALVTHEDKTVVFVAGDDNVAHQREVKVGAEQNGMVEIRSGVKPGEKVIRLGQYELNDGDKIKPAEKAEAAKGEDKS